MWQRIYYLSNKNKRDEDISIDDLLIYGDDCIEDENGQGWVNLSRFDRTKAAVRIMLEGKSFVDENGEIWVDCDMHVALKAVFDFYSGLLTDDSALSCT